MSVPAGFKATEVGVIPESWEVSTVGEEFHIQLGKMLDAERNRGLPKPYVGNRSVRWGRIDTAELGTVPMSSSDLSRYRLKLGDILVCEGGEVGRSAIWNGELPECYYQKALHRLRAKGNYSSGLLIEILYRASVGGGFTNFVSQTSIAHLTKEKFSTFPIPKPNEDEQAAIAEALSDMDEAIAAVETVIAKKRALKTATMQALLSGARRLPGCSGEWSAITLREVSDFITKGATPTTYGFAWQSSGVLFLRSECVSETGLDLTQSMFISHAAHRMMQRSAVIDGDLLVTITGNVGRVVRYCGPEPANLNQHIARVRIISPYAHPDFVYHYLAQPEVRQRYGQITTGQAYPQLSLVQVRNTAISLPAYEEQRRIAAVLSDMDSELALADTQAAKLRRLKTGMMQQLLTGKIRLV